MAYGDIHRRPAARPRPLSKVSDEGAGTGPARLAETGCAVRKARTGRKDITAREALPGHPTDLPDGPRVSSRAPLPLFTLRGARPAGAVVCAKTPHPPFGHLLPGGRRKRCANMIPSPCRERVRVRGLQSLNSRTSEARSGTSTRLGAKAPRTQAENAAPPWLPMRPGSPLSRGIHVDGGTAGSLRRQGSRLTVALGSCLRRNPGKDPSPQPSP
jgi:hypothetical protein